MVVFCKLSERLIHFLRFETKITGKGIGENSKNKNEKGVVFRRVCRREAVDGLKKIG